MVLRTARKCISMLLLVGTLLALSGCESLRFYSQAVRGHWQLMSAREPVLKLQQRDDLTAEMTTALQLSQRILTFAATELALEADGRYRDYVALPRDYVVWNVFAAPPYALTANSWCYPLVGCAPYRGYFSEQQARTVARDYEQRGYETYVGGAAAYSTLGWFDDPLLSTFLFWPEADLVNLLLHELAHSRLWVPGDAAFNEGFAEFVGQRGTLMWFDKQQALPEWSAWQRERRGWRRFSTFAQAAKEALGRIYELASPARERMKEATLEALQACYAAHREDLGGGRYDALMASRFNNAFLLSIGTYTDWQPAFAQMFDEVDGAWPAFYARVAELADGRPQDRARALQDSLQGAGSGRQQQVAYGGDHTDADQIDCQPFLRHGPHTEAPG